VSHAAKTWEVFGADCLGNHPPSWNVAYHSPEVRSPQREEPESTPLADEPPERTAEELMSIIQNPEVADILVSDDETWSQLLRARRGNGRYRD
jgi:hypothetical protein